MRPGADTSSSQPAITHHHERVGSQVIPSSPAATLFPAAVQVTQRRPLSVLNANVDSTCPTWVFSGTGRTRRFLVLDGAAIRSRLAARSPTVGCS